MVMPVEVAVNPLMVAGVSGSDRVIPESGIGLGKGTLKLNGPSGVVAGVAPLASIWVEAEPIRLGPPTAAAAWASDDGKFTAVWYPVMLKDWPTVGAVGDNVAEVMASLRTTVPTGVPGQYSSYAPVSVVGGPVVEVVPGAVVVVVPEPAFAMTGAIGDAVGVDVVMPDGVMLLLG
jgi:hypothetical protein